MVSRPLNGRRNGIYWHILQTHTAAEVAFNRYLALFPTLGRQHLWAKKPNESEKTVYLTGGRTVHFKSGHKLQDLRAETLDGAIIDECRQQQPELWTQVVRPMLGRYKGWCDFYSTPNGFDWVYDLYQAANDNPEWARFHAPSTEAWWWTPDEIISAQREMSEPVFAQEILAEFRSLTTGRVYYGFGDHNKREDCPFAPGKLWSPYHSIVLGLDFNVSPMSWCMGQHSYGQFWWFDQVRFNDSNTDECSKALVEKIQVMKQQGFRAPLDVIICGDASGNARTTKSNQSDYEILKAALKLANISFRNITPEANPSIRDRVNAVNAQCKSANGEVKLFVHPTYAKWVAHDLERVLWKEGSELALDPGKKRELTHMSDALGYPVYALAPIKAVREIGKTKLLQRPL